MKKLLAINGSDHAQQALEETIDRVRETGDDLDVAIYASEETDMTPDEVESSVKAVLKGVDLDVSIYQLGNHAGSDLVEIADRNEYDRLLIGVRSTTSLGKIRLGRVAEFVVLNAETTVTLVRSGSKVSHRSHEPFAKRS